MTRCAQQSPNINQRITWVIVSRRALPQMALKVALLDLSGRSWIYITDDTHVFGFLKIVEVKNVFRDVLGQVKNPAAILNFLQRAIVHFWLALSSYAPHIVMNACWASFLFPSATAVAVSTELFVWSKRKRRCQPWQQDIKWLNKSRSALGSPISFCSI